MFATTLQGFYLGLAMIIPIGAQNAFVLSRGIHRNHHLLTATLCCLCDLVLIGIGVFGGANLLAASPIGLALLTWGGVLFLGWFGIRSLRSAWRGQEAALADSPLVDGGQERAGHDPRSHSAQSPCLPGYPDVAWFLRQPVCRGAQTRLRGGGHAGFPGLVLRTGVRGGGTLPWLARGRVQQAIDLVVGLIMLVLAVKLALGAIPAS